MSVIQRRMHTRGALQQVIQRRMHTGFLGIATVTVGAMPVVCDCECACEDDDVCVVRSDTWVPREGHATATITYVFSSPIRAM